MIIARPLNGGMIFAGTSPDNHIVEMVEIPDHPCSWPASSIRNSRAVPTARTRCSAVLSPLPQRV